MTAAHQRKEHEPGVFHAINALLDNLFDHRDKAHKEMRILAERLQEADKTIDAQSNLLHTYNAASVPWKNKHAIT
jgi:hypothetical protein